MKDNAHWYQESIADTFSSLNSNKKGLSSEEAILRLKKYGENKLPEGKAKSIFSIFFSQFTSPLIYILLIASVVIYLIEDPVDAYVILGVLIFNAIIGTIQEGRAQNTLNALKSFVKTKATVLRDGKEQILNDKDVVPGDVLVLQEGEKVPADARIIFSSNLAIEEAALTGESKPVHKISETITKKDTNIAEQKNMVFKGTYVISGNGMAVVVATGETTFIGKISKEVAGVDTEIPLKKNIRYFSKLVIYAVAVVGVLMMVFGVFAGKPLADIFATVVSLAVSVIPEGLPIVLTLVLASGVWRMSKRNALVKKLQAVEALGQARVIAVDKTGTLTKNEMVVTEIYVGDNLYEVSGVGYKPEGLVSLNNIKINPVDSKDLILAGQISALCSSSRVMFSSEEKVWKVAGDPTDAAMLVFAKKLGLYKEKLESDFKLTGELPFDYKLKYHAISCEHKGEGRLFVVGAPEVILDLSKNIIRNGKSVVLDKKEKQLLDSKFSSMLASGLRVVAIAEKSGETNYDFEKISELNFVGFLGMKDALRQEVAPAMKKAKEAGIKVVMITGDHKLTAQSIAKEAGIFNFGDLILSGDDVDLMTQKELSSKLGKTSVFARVTPEHKLKIIKAYRARGEIIAMTGDGVNDAPSLVAADLGVSMGRIGTEVAKEASDIVLLDDDFGSIVSAVEEGRNIYKTIKKVILYLVSTGIGEALMISSALFLGYPIPLFPVQIIWLNFVTDGFLDISLAMEPKEEGMLKSKFEKPKKYLIDKLMSGRIILMALTMVIGTFLLFRQYLDYDIIKSSTISLTTLAVFQWFNAWNCRHETKSIFQMNPFSNKFLVGATAIVIALQILVVYNPVMQNLFRTTSLTFREWMMILPIAFSIIIVEEIRKAIARSKNKKSKGVLLGIEPVLNK